LGLHVQDTRHLGQTDNRLRLWWRQQHESLLLGIRGKMRAPSPGARSPSIIMAPRGPRHSEKPAVSWPAPRPPKATPEGDRSAEAFYEGRLAEHMSISASAN